MAPLLLKVLFCFSFYLYVGGYEWCSRGCWAELRIKENPPEPNIKTSNIIKYQDELNNCANIMGNPLSIFAQISNLSTILLSNIKENPIWAKYQDELNICANILGNRLSIFVHSFHFVNYLVFKYQIESNLSQISIWTHGFQGCFYTYICTEWFHHWNTICIINAFPLSLMKDSRKM